MTTEIKPYSIASVPAYLRILGWMAVYAILLFPFIIATPSGGIMYLVERLLQLLSITIWCVLHIKKRHLIRASHRLFVYAVQAWWLILIAITFLRVPSFQLTQINHWIAVWNLLLIAELYWEKHYVRHLYVLSLLFSSMVYLSTMLYIVFPEGLWYEESWIGTGDKARYLFGNYNQTGIVSLIALMVSGAYTLQTGRGKTNMLFLSLASLGTIAAMGSTTSTVGILLVVLYFYLQKAVKHPYLWICLFLVAYIVFFALIVWQGNAIDDWPLLASFVENVLGKNTTFTMRIYLWLRSVALIIDNPWTGYGVQGVEWMVNQIGGSGPHNLWLMILLEGGLVLCALFIAIIVKLFVSAFRHDSSRSAYMVVCVSVALLMSLFETYHYVCIFSIFVIAYYVCVSHTNKKSAVHAQLRAPEQTERV